MSRFIGILLVTLCGLGCTHAVHINHTSDFQTTKPLAEYRHIETRSEQQVILGMVGQTDYANEAYRQLMNQCEGGMVTGIQTRYSTSHNFMSWKNVVEMKGYCSE